MRRHGIRFTIRGLMIAVAIVAGLLALPDGSGVIAVPLSVPCLGVFAAEWLVFRGRRRLAAISFWAPATLINLAYAAACVAPDIYLLAALLFAWLMIVAPTLGALGAAWARLATRGGAAPRRSPPAAWGSVIALCLLPLVTIWTYWPLRLGFLASRPALDRLADRVAVGQAFGLPRWVGPFRVARTAVDPVSGNVGLMIDPNPNGPSGLVRVSPGNPPSRSGPFRGDDLEVDLGWGWEYREED